MINLITRYNTWYDTLGEPYRFLAFIVPTATIIILISVGTQLHSLPFVLIGNVGLAFAVILSFFRATRMGGIHLKVRWVVVALGAVSIAVTTLSSIPH